MNNSLLPIKLFLLFLAVNLIFVGTASADIRWGHLWSHERA